MQLAAKNHTVGNTRQYFTDFWKAIREGDWLTAAQVTADTADVTISGVAILEGHVVTFFVAGGVLNESFTVSIVATDNNSEISHDSVKFNVIAP